MPPAQPDAPRSRRHRVDPRPHHPRRPDRSGAAVRQGRSGRVAPPGCSLMPACDRKRTILPGTGRGTTEGGGGARAEPRYVYRTGTPRVTLHHASHSPPTPNGEDRTPPTHNPPHTEHPPVGKEGVH